MPSIKFTFKNIVLLVIFLFISILVMDELLRQEAQPTEGTNISLPVQIKSMNLPGKSPEGLPKDIARPKLLILPPSIQKEAEDQEKGLMLDGSDYALIPALLSTNLAKFRIKPYNLNQTFFHLKSLNSQMYITVSVKNKLFCITLAIVDKTNVTNIIQTFSYTFKDVMKANVWASYEIEIQKTQIKLVAGDDVYYRERNVQDSSLPSDCNFSTLLFGAKSESQDDFGMCRYTDVDFFGTTFGIFPGSGNATFPLNLRKHLTIYPLDLSFNIKPVKYSGTLIVIYENDKNYLKLELIDLQLQTTLKSKGRKHVFLFENKINPDVTTSIKLLVEDYISVNYVMAEDNHSKLFSEKSTQIGLQDTNIYWLSSAARIFIGGVPLFPKEVYTGVLNNIKFQDVTSLF